MYKLLESRSSLTFHSVWKSSWVVSISWPGAARQARLGIVAEDAQTPQVFDERCGFFGFLVATRQREDPTRHDSVQNERASGIRHDGHSRTCCVDVPTLKTL
jgi:hypothetical protein